MNKFLEKMYQASICVSTLILIGGTMMIFESAVTHISEIILKDSINILCAIIYASSCVYCYLVFRNDKKDKERWHQGWVSRQLKRVQIKIEKNGKVVLDTTKKLSCVEEMKFYDESELACYLLTD
jgi:hypothetical protein